MIFDHYIPEYDPPAEGESFYVMAFAELTIYGHTIDGYIKAKYPHDDWPHILASRRDGREFGCWHSQACTEGESGSNPVSALRPITYEAFMQAAEQGWPYVADLTTLAPVAAVGSYGEDGRIGWHWSSLDNTLGEKNQG